MGCIGCLPKCLVKFTFNVVFLLGGLALLIIGAIYKLEMAISVPVQEGTNVSTAPNLLIIVGTITLAVGFLGCCGAWRENYCMLTSFGIILICLLIIQMAAGIFALVMIQKGSNLEQDIQSVTKKLFESYENNTFAVDAIQRLFKCCGFATKEEYEGNLPKSCCSAQNRVNCSESNAFSRICKTPVYYSIKIKLKILGFVAIILCSTVLLAIIFSFCIARSIKKERE